MSQHHLSALRQSINSLEIAKLVQTRHDSVKRTIKRLAKQGIIRNPPLVDLEKINNLGLYVQVSSYLFTGEQGKIDSIVVVAQLCPAFTARIVARWQELENSLNNRHELLALRTEALKNPLWGAIYRYKALKLANQEIARLLSLNVSTIRRHVRRMEMCGLLRPPQNLKQQQLALQFMIGGGAK